MNETTSTGASTYTHKAILGGEELAERGAGSTKDTTAATIAAADGREALRAEREKSIPPVQITPQEWSIAFAARKSPGEVGAKPAKRLGQQPVGSIAVDGVGVIAISLFEGEDGVICADVRLDPRRAS